MADYQNVKIKVFASPKEYASRDLQDEQQIAQIIREQVLPKTSVDYYGVDVKVKRKADESADYLIAYMLRKDTYTADVVKIEIDDTADTLKVERVIENYDDSDEEDDEEGVFEESQQYGFDFIAATPVPDIASAKNAVNTLHQMAVNAGLNSKKLLGSSATVANYKNYLKSGVKGFVNVGHGNPSGIVLHDGALRANWFQGISNKALKPAVVYFNSCQVCNDPLKSAVIHAGARTFIGGIVNLGIGSSEEVCKCFWQQALTSIRCMGDILRKCEKDKYPTQGAHGIVGNSGPFKQGWYTNQTVVRTHAKCSSQMAWAIISKSCWLRIKPASGDGVGNIFMLLCDALANNRKVDVYVRNGQIEQATLR